MLRSEKLVVVKVSIGVIVKYNANKFDFLNLSQHEAMKNTEYIRVNQLIEDVRKRWIRWKCYKYGMILFGEYVLYGCKDYSLSSKGYENRIVSIG